MSSAGENPSRSATSLAEAFDWRAVRTWGVFLGSALGTGIAVAAVVLLVLAIVDGPSGDVSWGRVVLAIFVLAPSWVAVAAVLRVGSKPSPRGKVETTRAVLGWAIPGWVRSWLNFLPLGLWIALALLPLLAMIRVLAGQLGDAWQVKDKHDFLPYVIIAVWAVTNFSDHLPGLLQRWAKPKAPPTPSPPDQADSGQELQP